MNKFILPLVILLLLSSEVYSQWVRTSGPEGNSISALKNISGKIYAGTKNDGLFRSTNSGESWQPINNGIEFIEIRDVEIKSGYIFAGSFNDGVYRSSNGGTSWISPAPGNKFKVKDLVIKDNFIFAASTGVYRSSDNGETWQLSPYLFQFSYVAMCVSGNNIFAARFGDMHKSTDNGETWVRQLQFESQAIFSMYSKDNLMFVGSRNKIYRSTNNGDTFDEIPLQFTFSIVNINSFTSIESTLYMGNSYNGVYKSTDDGLTWTPMIEGMGGKDVRKLTSDGSTLIAGTNYSGMYISTNDGSTWQKSNDGLPPSSTIDELFSDREFVYAGTRDGIYSSGDNGITWQKLTGESDTINYGTVTGICTLDGKLFAAARYQFKSTIFRRDGQTWTLIDNGLPETPFIFGMTSSGNNVLAGTENGIYYSTNYGDTWQLSNSGANLAIDDISASGNGHVYAIARSYGIYVSANDGLDWYLTLQLSNLSDLSAHDNYAYATGFVSSVFFTNDNGNGWYSRNFGENVFGVQYIDNGIVLAATAIEGYRIWISQDYGLNYSPFSSGLNPNSIAINFASTNNYMFAGMDYNGVWRILKPGITNIDPEINSPGSYSLSQNYPNPFNPETTIKYSIPKQSMVKLSVYDIVGREVTQLVNEIKNTGSYTVKFDGTNLSSGIYFYRIEAGDFTEVKKMELIK